MCFKITDLRQQLYLPGANELRVRDTSVPNIICPDLASQSSHDPVWLTPCPHCIRIFKHRNSNMISADALALASPGHYKIVSCHKSFSQDPASSDNWFQQQASNQCWRIWKSNISFPFFKSLQHNRLIHWALTSSVPCKSIICSPN